MDRRHDPDRVAGVIRGLDPDIVALQELEANHRRSGRIDQPGLMAERLGMDYVYHPSRIRGEAGFGNAIFSRLRLRPVRSALLPGMRLVKLQHRSALWAQVEAEGRRIQVINTHFGLLGRERLLQARALCSPSWIEHPECRHDPRILCGDFNATPRSRPYRLLAGALRDALRLAGDPKARTWPSVLPVVRYDHVFVGHGLDVARVSVIRGGIAAKASDHLPVVMEFSFSK
jgi:endonuclease/exonuclease/phosphatase family metal-dependent hydrolase